MAVTKQIIDANPSCKPTKAVITLRNILDQVKRDLYDKEVQSAATYSYLWMADQMGHIALGLVIVTVLGWLSFWFGGAWPPVAYWPLLVGAAAVAYWEISAFRAYAAKATGLFRPDTAILAKNAVVAAVYMILGVVAGYAWMMGPAPGALATVGVAVVAIVLAPFWLRQKIVWQKGAIPFLFRLSDFHPNIPKSAARQLQEWIDEAVEANDKNHLSAPAGPVVVVYGRLGAGKTSLACGIGTESAFGGLKVRYVTFDKLAQMAFSDSDDEGPDNIQYWPWIDSQVLVIDDIDTGGGRGSGEYLDIGEFQQIVEYQFKDYRKCLGRRMSVWVLGDKPDAEVPLWRDEIVKICSQESGGAVHPPECLVIKCLPLDAPAAPVVVPGAPILSPAWLQRAASIAGWIFVGVSTLAFAVSLIWLAAEQSWQPRADMGPQEAFRDGTLGLEIMPYKLAAVLDEVAPKAMQRFTPDGHRVGADKAWWQNFGFNAGGPKTPSDKCPLPLGFTVTKLLPVSAEPVPVDFVGLSCAACHSARLHTADPKDKGTVVLGTGAISADVIAFTDAFKQATAQASLTPAVIQDAYDRKCGADTGLWASTIGRPLEAFLIQKWLDGFRATTRGDASKYDLPFHGGELYDPNKIGAGPSRTRPFRSVVRNELDFPGAKNFAYSKVPAAFEQSRAMRPRSQFDGSVANPATRSLIAAYTSGASLAGLANPAVAHNVRAAAAYTEVMGLATGIKTFAEMFPAVPAPDPALLSRGRDSYMRNCATCHGHRPDPKAAWDVKTDAKWIHKITRLVMPQPGDKYDPPPYAIGTDPERVLFRYADILPTALWARFPGSPIPLAAAEKIPACTSFEKTLPAGYTMRKEQQEALAGLDERARSKGDFVQANYWTARREPEFETARRMWPAGHPLTFGPSEICYDVDDLGYFNNPIPFAYLRAPYLHNGSVPTMRQLLNLDERMKTFCRGDNAYDPLAMGIVTHAPDAQGRCGTDLPFAFDASLIGNSNAGHDYPWRRDEIAGDPAKQAELEALLVYLRTQ